MRSLALTLTALALTACQTRPVVPKIVHVPVTQFVPLPANLTKDCDVPAKKAATVGEAVRLANARLESLKACNKRLEAVRKLQP